MNEEQFVVVPEVEPEFKTTLTPEQLNAATAQIEGRSFSGRHPELGKMINCAVCDLRHRASQKCVQRFTNKIGDFEYFHEETNAEGETKLVPTLRTAIPHDQKPTARQINGRPKGPNQFVGPRYKPHPSKIKLQFIEKVRAVYSAWFERFQTNLLRIEDETFRRKIEETYNHQFKDRLHAARIVAARQLRKEKKAERKYRRKLGIR